MWVELICGSSDVPAGRVRVTTMVSPFPLTAMPWANGAGTVARAYKMLEEAQIIVTRRGAGTRT